MEYWLNDKVYTMDENEERKLREALEIIEGELLRIAAQRPDDVNARQWDLYVYANETCEWLWPILHYKETEDRK